MDGSTGNGAVLDVFGLRRGLLAVDRAADALRAERGMTPDEARRWLRRRAEDEGMALSQVARVVLEELGA